MFTVEVLISIFILFLVITLSATSSKFFNQILKQQERYKSLYSIVFSIKDKISEDICIKYNDLEGEISNIQYRAKCNIIKEKRGLVKDYDDEKAQIVVNYSGKYLFQLYEVELEIVEYKYVTHYYINKYK